MGRRAQPEPRFQRRLTGYASLSRGLQSGRLQPGCRADNWRYFRCRGACGRSRPASNRRWSTIACELNASMFYSRREDQQVRDLRRSTQTIRPHSCLRDDNNDGGVQGLEADLRWFASDALEVVWQSRPADLRDSQAIGRRNFPGCANRDRRMLPVTRATGSYTAATAASSPASMRRRGTRFISTSATTSNPSPTSSLHARAGYEGETGASQIWARNLTRRTVRCTRISTLAMSHPIFRHPVHPPRRSTTGRRDD